MNDATRERLVEALGQLPRVPLAMLPTPLVKAGRLSAALGGPSIWLKREDLAGLGVGGSKYRILEYTIGEALARGADVLIAAGLAQSNHPQQIASAAAHLGVPLVVLLGGAEGHMEWQGNMLLTGLSGAEIHILPAAGFEELRVAQEELAERLRAAGRRPAIITLTRQVHLSSVFAYANYAVELAEQMERGGIEARALYVGSGGPTYAGMLLGSLALGRPFRVVGMSPLGTADRGRRQVAGLVADATRELGIQIHLGSDDISVTGDYLGPGHGVVTPATVEAIRLLASTEGVFVDPVYAGKAMAGLIDHVRHGKFRPDETVVFALTGGLPALFAYAREVMPDPLPASWTGHPGERD